MDWLKDKKNQPIVAGALAVIIIGAVVVAYFTMFAGGGDSAPVSETAATAPADQTAGAPVDPNAASPSAMPGPAGDPMAAGGAPGATTPGGTGAAPAAAAPTPLGGAVPMEKSRPDPFLPAGYKPPTVGPKPKLPIRDLMPTLENWSRFRKPGNEDLKPDLSQPVRRMAGLIVSDRIYAIIETAGKSEIVQPGDMLGDRLAKVERIERDKVVLKTMDEKPKYLTVRMASAPRTETPMTTPGASGSESFRDRRGLRGPMPIGPAPEPTADM